jgi:hypothetical protein
VALSLGAFKSTFNTIFIHDKVKKPHWFGGLRPQTVLARRVCGGLAIHPRAQHWAFWLFHVKAYKRQEKSIFKILKKK